MKDDPKQRRLARAKRYSAALTSAAISLSTPAGAVPGSISGAAAERMVAASPQRERHRAWATCIDYVANLIIAQRGGIDKIRSMIPLGCGDEESRLAGSLVAKYGYAQGNAAMRALKQRAEAGFLSRIHHRDNPRDPGFVEKTVDGWEVKRLKAGCMAIGLRRNGINSGGSATVLERGMGVAKIYFLLAGNDADMANKKLTRSFDVNGLVYREDERFSIALTLSPKPYDDGVMYEVVARDNVIAQLDQGTDIQIEVPTGLESAPTWPTRYPLNGIAAAWAAVERCGLR